MSWRTMFMAIVLLTVSCSGDQEIPAISEHDLLVVGAEKDLNLISALSSSHGGFYIGTQSKETGRQKIRIDYYDSSFNHQWSTLLGADLDNRLLRIFEDPDGNLLVSGMSYGLEKENEPLDVHRFWTPVVFLLDDMGKVQWHKNLDFNLIAFKDVGTNERMADIIRDASGNYILGGEMVDQADLQGMLFKVNSSEPYSRYYASNNNDGKVEAVFEGDNLYFMMEYNQYNGGDATLQFKTLSKLMPAGANRFKTVYSEPWPWGNSYSNGRISSFKQQLSNDFVYNYIFADHITRYTWHTAASYTSKEEILLPFGPVESCFQVSNRRFVFKDSHGTLIQTNGQFELDGTLETTWDIDELVQLENGEYVGFTSRDNFVYAVKLGKIQ